MLPLLVSVCLYVAWIHEIPWWLSGKESICQCRRRGFDLWLRKIPWRRAWQPTPVLLPGKSHGQRNLARYSPWGRKRVRHETKQLNNNSKQQQPEFGGHPEAPPRPFWARLSWTGWVSFIPQPAPRWFFEQTCVWCQQALQSIRETCPEVLLGCGNYEVSGKKPKNQGATWAESININIPEQAPALGFLCWCANLLSTKGLFTPFWYSLQFIYLHKEEALTGQFLMNKRPCVIPTAVYNPSCPDL